MIYMQMGIVMRKILTDSDKPFSIYNKEEFPEINDNLFKEAQNKMKGFFNALPKILFK